MAPNLKIITKNYILEVFYLFEVANANHTLLHVINSDKT